MFRTITYKNIVFFFYCLVVASMLLSPFLLSIGLIGLCILAVFRLEVQDQKIIFQLNEGGLKRMKNILKKPSFAVLTLFFFISLIWFYPIGEWSYLLTRLRIKVPFLLLPLAFLGLPRFREEDFKNLMLFTLVFYTIISLGVLFNYIQNYEVLTEQIRKGQHIPTPRNHIRYSLLVAWAIIGGVFFSFKYTAYRWLVIGLTFFLFLFLHLLSVKSGLLVLYSCLSFGLLQYIWLKRKILLGLIGLAVLFLLPIIAYKTIPSFKNKVQYFYYDIQMFKNGEGGNYSDAGRIVSLQAGWDIAKKNWLWGVGTANIRQEVSAYFDQEFPDYPTVFMPQNQFLFIWASAGIFGLLAGIIAFFFPLVYQQNYRQAFFLNFYLSIFVIIMIEHALENAVGVAHYLFFLLLFLSFLNKTEDVDRLRPKQIL